MRKLTILVLTVAALYSGYWFIGASAAEKGANAAVAELIAEGWAANVAEVQTRGFPSRFDTTLTDVQVLSPDRSIGWTAPFVQSLALSYKPNEVIIAFPNTHQVHVGGANIALKTDGFRASAGVMARPSAPLSHLTAELVSGTATFSHDVAVSLGKSLLALRPAETENTYDAYINLTDIDLPAPLVQALQQAGPISARLSQATLDTRIGLDRALDRHLSDGQPPQLDSLDLKGLNVQWGAVSMRGSGSLNIDPSGIPTGEITLSLRNWGTLIDAGVVLGAVPESLSQTIKTMANSMAAGSDTLELPISFKNGSMSIGLFPLGTAPRFR